MSGPSTNLWTTLYVMGKNTKPVQIYARIVLSSFRHFANQHLSKLCTQDEKLQTWLDSQYCEVPYKLCVRFFAHAGKRSGCNQHSVWQMVILEKSCLLKDTNTERIRIFLPNEFCFGKNIRWQNWRAETKKLNAAIASPRVSPVSKVNQTFNNVLGFDSQASSMYCAVQWDSKGL